MNVCSVVPAMNDAPPGHWNAMSGPNSESVGMPITVMAPSAARISWLPRFPWIPPAGSPPVVSGT
ncbi:MAG: hypothetical protein IPM22_19285 [Betaproteobacteria bacterium]|nr:hypothetical protein [Betaproteobacteria bacterium]